MGCTRNSGPSWLFTLFSDITVGLLGLTISLVRSDSNTERTLSFLAVVCGDVLSYVCTHDNTFHINKSLNSSI